MNLRILGYDEAVLAFLPHANAAAFLTHLQRKAAVAIGDAIVKDAAAYQRIEPGPDAPTPMITHRWRVGVDVGIHKTEDAILTFLRTVAEDEGMMRHHEAFDAACRAFGVEMKYDNNGMNRLVPLVRKPDGQN